MIYQIILRSTKFEKTFTLATAAMDYGIRNVLIQKDELWVDHSTAFFSEKLYAAQTKHSIIKKEAPWLMLAYQHFDVICPLVISQLKFLLIIIF